MLVSLLLPLIYNSYGSNNYILTFILISFLLFIRDNFSTYSPLCNFLALNTINAGNNTILDIKIEDYLVNVIVLATLHYFFILKYSPKISELYNFLFIENRSVLNNIKKFFLNSEGTDSLPVVILTRDKVVNTYTQFSKAFWIESNYIVSWEKNCMALRSLWFDLYQIVSLYQIIKSSKSRFLDPLKSTGKFKSLVNNLLLLLFSTRLKEVEFTRLLSNFQKELYTLKIYVEDSKVTDTSALVCELTILCYSVTAQIVDLKSVI